VNENRLAAVGVVVVLGLLVPAHLYDQHVIGLTTCGLIWVPFLVLAMIARAI